MAIVWKSVCFGNSASNITQLRIGDNIHVKLSSDDSHWVPTDQSLGAAKPNFKRKAASFLREIQKHVIATDVSQLLPVDDKQRTFKTNYTYIISQERDPPSCEISVTIIERRVRFCKRTKKHRKLEEWKLCAFNCEFKGAETTADLIRLLTAKLQTAINFCEERKEAEKQVDLTTRMAALLERFEKRDGTDKR